MWNVSTWKEQPLTAHINDWFTLEIGCRCMVGLEGNSLLWVPSKEPNNSVKQELNLIRLTENSSWWKAYKLAKRKLNHISLVTIVRLAEKVLLVHHIQPKLHLQNLLMKIISIFWKPVKVTYNSSLRQKIFLKSLGLCYYEVVWKMAVNSKYVIP